MCFHLQHVLPLTACVYYVLEIFTVDGIDILGNWEEVKVLKFVNFEANLVEFRVQRGYSLFGTQCSNYSVYS